MSKTRRYSQLSASIIDACKKGDVETVSALLERGANVNTDSVHHRRSPYFVSDPLLHKAVRYGHVEIVQVLLSHGARVNVRNCVYETALHASPTVEISELLINHGASVNAIDAYNRTPLHMAASFGALAILQTLLKKGAKLDIQTASGCTALHDASHCFQKHCDLVVTELLDSGANVNVKNMYGETPLHVAAKSGKHETVAILLENGTNFDARNHLGQTPIMATLHKIVSGFKRNEYCKPSALVATVKVLVDVGSFLDYSEAEDMVVGGPVRPRESAVEEWQRLEIRHRMVRFLIQVGCGTQHRISEKVLFILVNGGHVETFQLLHDCGYRIHEPLLVEICGTVRHGDDVLRKAQHLISQPLSLQCLCRITIRRNLSEALVYRSKGRMVKVFTRIRNYVLRKTANFIRLSTPRRIVTSADVDPLPLPESVKSFLSFGGYQELTDLKNELEGRRDLPQIYLHDEDM